MSLTNVILLLVLIGGVATIAWGLSIWSIVESLEVEDDDDA